MAALEQCPRGYKRSPHNSVAQKDLAEWHLGAKALCISIVAAGFEGKSLVEENDQDHT